MSRKDLIYLVIGSTIGAGTMIVARWTYKKLKQGKLDKWFSKIEKKTLMEALREFLEINGGKDDK